MRMLLLKQDLVARLEEDLDRIDDEEEKPLFLGNCRRDRNGNRKKALAELDEALRDYGKQTHRTLKCRS